ncbi:hypothetical protein [Streptomyces hokutonensis]|uniref:hypothetical protein n=1 Tax=Streptomyces hokutonensis TaxID=1306990 RepID=UPI00037686F5|nr:hypothetical protein [Streptomyces hokutonensis]
MRATLPLPTPDVGLLADDVLHNPYPALREIREADPAVRLTAYDAWMLPRYDHVRAALSDHERFSSTHGAGIEALGHGLHGCVGQRPARLEAHAVLGALVRHVSSIALAGEPVRKLNNVIRGMASLPVTVRAEGQ